ncbi:hypothetical protein HYFRA_00005101 [Hymenoscyphus fraxineus]|uniref:DUF2423 domain-containing protein n=1 Tax=Hymenoscyphus fraxineus TaxID=746836 RepID=A0A9N9LCK4_9HELO|nr:hypothetical protein HYFRA_00005101 [Hymenoscyphus fraxineus]
MAKGARSSSRKANNAALKSKVFGPVEAARNERMQAKLLALIAQPKPKPEEKDVEMEVTEATTESKEVEPVAESKTSEAMEVDGEPAKPTAPARKNRIEKRGTGRRSSRKASIVFPKYKDGKRVTRPRQKK